MLWVVMNGRTSWMNGCASGRLSDDKEVINSILVLLVQITWAAEALSETNEARNRLSLSFKNYLKEQMAYRDILDDIMRYDWRNYLPEADILEYKQKWSKGWEKVLADVTAFNMVAILLTPTSMIRWGIPTKIPKFDINTFFKGTSSRPDLSVKKRLNDPENSSQIMDEVKAVEEYWDEVERPNKEWAERQAYKMKKQEQDFVDSS